MIKNIENVLTFLGTGGGGSVVYSQARASGGMHLVLDDKVFIIDPGPGSIVWFRKMKLKEPDILLLSHLHQDHSTDANVYIDGMKEPIIIAEKHCVEISEYYPCISKYHIEKSRLVYKVSGGEEINIPDSNIKIFVTKSNHYAPTVGFKIVGSRTIGYVSDGSYFENMEKQFEECNLIIMNILVPYGKKEKEKKHMSIEGAIKFVNGLNKKPELIIIQHFSFWMLKNNVYKQAKIIEEKTNVKTIAAKDFMQIDLNSLKIIENKKMKNSLSDFF
jgi:ribonuclease BN (tRNA processing enzyme)